MSLMHTTGNIVDDLPHDDYVVKDLKFFVKQLNGVLPFEIVITFKDVVYDNFSNISKIQKKTSQHGCSGARRENDEYTQIVRKNTSCTRNLHGIDAVSSCSARGIRQR